MSTLAEFAGAGFPFEFGGETVMLPALTIGELGVIEAYWRARRRAATEEQIEMVKRTIEQREERIAALNDVLATYRDEGRDALSRVVETAITTDGLAMILHLLLERSSARGKHSSNDVFQYCLALVKPGGKSTYEDLFKVSRKVLVAAGIREDPTHRLDEKPRPVETPKESRLERRKSPALLPILFAISAWIQRMTRGG